MSRTTFEGSPIDAPMDEATAKALIAKSRELVAELEAERARLRFISKCLMIIAAFCCALAAYNLYHSL